MTFSAIKYKISDLAAEMSMREIDYHVWAKIFEDLDYISLCRFAMASKETNSIFLKSVPLSQPLKRMEWSRELSSLGHEACETLEAITESKIDKQNPAYRNQVVAILRPIFLVVFCSFILSDLPGHFFRMISFILQALTSDKELSFEFFSIILWSYIIYNLAFKGFVYNTSHIKNILRNDQNLFHLIPSLERKIRGIEFPNQSYDLVTGRVANFLVPPIFIHFYHPIKQPDSQLPKLVAAARKQVNKWKNPSFFFHRKLLHGENPKFSDDLEAKLNTALIESIAKLT